MHRHAETLDRCKWSVFAWNSEIRSGRGEHVISEQTPYAPTTAASGRESDEPFVIDNDRYPDLRC